MPLVNCAGTVDRESVQDMNVEVWDRDLNVNLRATSFVSPEEAATAVFGSAAQARPAQPAWPFVSTAAL